jgi:hypothetical protein
LLILLSHIKKILKHLDLWDVKRKPRPMANVYPPLEGPPIDVFPAYDEQPGPSTDDPPSVWILRRDKLHQRSGLVRLRRIALQRLVFKKTNLRQTGFLCPNFRNLGQFEAKCFLDNTIFI